MVTPVSGQKQRQVDTSSTFATFQKAAKEKADRYVIQISSLTLIPSTLCVYGQGWDFTLIHEELTGIVLIHDLYFWSLYLSAPWHAFSS